MTQLLQLVVSPVWLFLLLTQAIAISTAAREVIPGPGLPSLESLNLTSEDLYTMPASEFAKPELRLEKRAANCFDASRQCTLDDAVACYNYLQNLGTTQCRVTVSGDAWTELCRAGNCAVEGFSIPRFIYDQTDCANVAYGVSVIAYTCNPTNGHAGAGQDYARNKSNIAVRMYW